MKKFKVGDVITYKGSEMGNMSSYLMSGRVQKIVGVINNRVETLFLDTETYFSFDIESYYYKMCEIYVGDYSKCEIYDNGIPVVWGDEI